MIGEEKWVGLGMLLLRHLLCWQMPLFPTQHHAAIPVVRTLLSRLFGIACFIGTSSGIAGGLPIVWQQKFKAKTVSIWGNSGIILVSGANTALPTHSKRLFLIKISWITLVLVFFFSLCVFVSFLETNASFSFHSVSEARGRWVFCIL